MTRDCCVSITVSGCTARIASFLPRRGWSIHSKGYLIYTSRNKTLGIRRGARAHVVTVERLASERPVYHFPSGVKIHHQDNDKLNCCPYNLLCVWHDALNPSPSRKDPYTGLWLSVAEWERRYGAARRVAVDAPDWVMEESDADGDTAIDTRAYAW
jgi:hypothetical protein